MTTPKLEKIWIDTYSDGLKELRLDWSNDYHHAFYIRRPHGPKQVANALREAAIFVARDVVLNEHASDPMAKAWRGDGT